MCKKVIGEDGVVFGDKFYHVSCAEKKSSEKSSSKSKWKNYSLFLNDYKEDYKKYLHLQSLEFENENKNIPKYVECAKNKIRDIKFQISVDELIKNLYDTTVIPWNIINSIYCGTYRGLSCPIPAEHLYDMWLRKRKFLVKTYEKNKSLGKNFDTSQRIKYDLAILVNKYPDYLKWKKKQEQKVFNRNEYIASQKEAKAIRSVTSSIVQKQNEDINIENLSNNIW